MKYRLYDPEFGDMLYGINAKFAKGKNLTRMVFTGLSIYPIDLYEGDIFWYQKGDRWYTGFISQIAEDCFILMPHGDSLESVLRDCVNFYVGNIYRHPHLLNIKRRDEICF